MTVQELINVLEMLEDKDQDIYIPDGTGDFTTEDLTIARRSVEGYYLF